MASLPSADSFPVSSSGLSTTVKTPVIFNTFHPARKNYKLQTGKLSASKVTCTEDSGFYVEGGRKHKITLTVGSEPCVAELNGHKAQSGAGSVGMPHECAEGEALLSFIVSSRVALGLGTEACRQPAATEREQVLLSSGPIAGVRDLKAVSRRLASMQAFSPHQVDRVSSDPTQFVYCLRQDTLHPRLRPNPYNLVIVGATQARAQGTYYTVSAFTVARVQHDGDMSVTTVQRWLWERRAFMAVSALSFFHQYRQWKAFVKWRKWVRVNKFVSCRSFLQANLFSADPLMQTPILHVHSLCLFSDDASSRYSTTAEEGCVSPASMLELVAGSAVTLDEFMVSQRAAVERMKNTLVVLREKIVATVVATCKNVVDTEGILGLEGQPDNVEEPLRADVLQWRAVSKRLQRFVRLCEQLSLSLLQSIAMEAVTSLQSSVISAAKASKQCCKVLEEHLQTMMKEVLSQPFSRNIEDRIILEEVEEEELPFHCVQFIPAQGIELFPTKLYNCLLDSVVPGLVCDGKGSSSVDSLEFTLPLFGTAQRSFAQLWAVQLVLRVRDKGYLHPQRGSGKGINGGTNCGSQYTAVLSPTREEFVSVVNELFQLYQAIVSSFLSLLHDRRVLSYLKPSQYDVLMQLEEEGGNKYDLISPPTWPNTFSLLSGYRPYRTCVEYIKTAVEVSMVEAENITAFFQCFCEMVDCCSQVNVDTILSKQEWSASFFQKAFAFFHDQVHSMKSMVNEFGVGVLQLKVDCFQEECLSHPLALLRELDKQLPHLASYKSHHLVGKMKESISQLQTSPHTIDGFVLFLDYVDHATTLIPRLEAETLVITNLYSIAQEFDVPTGEEDIAMYKALFPQLRYLKNLLLKAEATKSECVYEFSTTLRSQVTKLLSQAMKLKGNIGDVAMLHVDGKNTPEKTLEVIKDYELQLGSVLNQAKAYVQLNERFATISSSKRRYHAVDPSSHSWTPEEVYDEIATVEQALTLRKALFEAWRDWTRFIEAWTHIPLQCLDLDKLQMEVNTFVHTVRYLENGLPPSQLMEALQEEVMSFHSNVPTLSYLLNPSLKLRHWEDIEMIIGGWIGKDKGTTTISSLVQMKVFGHHMFISSVSAQASHELTLEVMLKKVASEWIDREFTLVPYLESSGRQTHILGGIETLLSALEDSLSTLATLRSSRYVAPIKHAVLDWESRLSLLLKTVEQWEHCQRNWLYLESIFSAVDIQRQLLSGELKLFQQADKLLRDTIRIAIDKSIALQTASTPGILEKFQVCSALLEQAFRTLEDYLEAKRLTFPRFYFISDIELLDVLAHSKNPNGIQPCLSKIFGGINRLEFSRDIAVKPAVTAMISIVDERIPLSKGVITRGSPDQWLATVEQTMVSVVRSLMKKAYDSCSKSTWKEWVLSHIGQVVLTVSAINWTVKVETCLQNPTSLNQLGSLHNEWLCHLETLTILCASEELAISQRQTLTALLTLGVHKRDVIQSLMLKKVKNESEFEWIRHLRCYWDHGLGSCWLAQCFSKLCYGYEYLGNHDRLVLTPLTERCYITFTSALHVNLGGSPVGPAGTGKSETIKDLAKAMGKLCLVFNCSYELDYRLMSRFFLGLCQSGAWCCFDEFNRISIEVLSVVAQQLQIIKATKDQESSKAMFDGREVKLVPTCAIFITMNPDYRGRVELPENVQCFFRPVAMMVPNTAKVAEVLLFTQGFTLVLSLASKLSKFCETASRQLSEEVHYDFGLRFIKAVITLAGEYLTNIKRNNIDHSTEICEQIALLNALRDSTLPKLVSSDNLLMEMLFGNLFPGVVQGFPLNPTVVLESYITSCLDELSIQHVCSQVNKCLQLYGRMQVRHGIMLLGPTGSGKSTILKLLQAALCKAHQDYYGHLCDESASLNHSSLQNCNSSPIVLSNKDGEVRSNHVSMRIINPKCFSLGELFGHFNPVTREWNIGVASKIIQAFSQWVESAQRKKENTANGDRDHVQGNSSHQSLDNLGDSGTVVVPMYKSEGESDDQHSASRQSYISKGLPYASCAPVGWKWMVFDGPVDCAIENFNSVLDDSKVLCLSNGGRVQLHPGMRLMFETDNLIHASPATIGRCGIVYVDRAALGWRPYVLSWIKSLPDNLKKDGKTHLLNLFDNSIERALQFLIQHASQLSCKVSSLGAVSILCNILKQLLCYYSTNCGGLSPKLDEVSMESVRNHSDIQSHNVAGIPSRHIPPFHSKKQSGPSASSGLGGGKALPFLRCYPERIHEFLSKAFVFSYVWAFGGNFENMPEEEEDVADTLTLGHPITRGGLSARMQFDALVHEIFSKPPTTVELPNSRDLVYSYYLDLTSCSFVPWKCLVPSAKEIFTHILMAQKGVTSNLQSRSLSSLVDLSAPMGLLQDATRISVVPTVDLVRLSFLTTLLASGGHNVLISGKRGAGKTLLLEYLNTLLSDKLSVDIISDVLTRRLKTSTLVSHSHLTTEDFSNHNITSVSLHMSSQLSAPMFQSNIEGSFIKKNRYTLEAPTGYKRLLLCLDDLSCASTDAHGYQSCVEVIRELMDKEGCYDRKSFMWKSIAGMSVVAAIGRRDCSNHLMSERCIRQFHAFCLLEPSHSTLVQIYSTHLMKSFLSYKNSDLIDMLPHVVDCAIFVFSEIRAKLLCSPAKPQYTFSIRDLSKIFSGFLRVKHTSIQSKEDVVNLLCHEVYRVFYDRCALQDRHHILQILSEAMRIHLKVVRSADQFGEDMKNQIHLYEGFTDSSRGYCAIKSFKKVTQFLERMQGQYNIAEGKNSRMMFFPLACEHILRIARVLQQPAGHLLLIGIGGVGRTSSVQLASYICGSNFYHLIPQHKNKNEHRELIKRMLIDCALKNQSCVLLVNENVGDEIHLFHDLQELVMTNQVIGLFNKEEVNSILLQMAEKEQESFQKSNVSLQQYQWSMFVSLVRRNLHIVLCFSPLSPVLTSLSRMFPGLMLCATIDVFDDWSSRALYEVALRELHRLLVNDSEEILKKDYFTQVAMALVRIHGSVVSATFKAQKEYGCYYLVTPSIFFNCVQTFCSIVLKQTGEVSNKISHLKLGLQQLHKANDNVTSMRKELTSLQPQLLLKTEEAEHLLLQLSTEQSTVQAMRVSVDEERDAVAGENEHIAALTRDSEIELLSVLPALEKAERGLNAMTLPDLMEIRTYATPPAMVTHVMSAVCVLLGHATDWDTVKFITKNATVFIKRLTTFDKDNVPDKVLHKLGKYSGNPDFNPDNVAHYSRACKSFCQWVLAIEHYAKVYRKVQPKRQHYQRLADKHVAVQLKLETKQNRLRELETQLSVMEEKYLNVEGDTNILKKEYQEISQKLQMAEILMQSLRQEQVHWNDALHDLTSKSSSLVGDSVLRASCLVYSGPLTPSYRQSELARWKHICQECKLQFDLDFTCEHSMAVTEKVLEWCTQGLSCDTVSIQNAILISQSLKTPLIIDPQGQALRWIKAAIKGDDLIVLSINSSKLMMILEQAAQGGLPVVILDVDEGNLSLLESFLISQSSQLRKYVVKLGKTEIECSSDFRLYLICNETNPKLTSNLCTKTTIVNFSSSFEGLQDLLLSIAVNLDHPTLESQYSALQQSILSDQKERKNLESSLLNLLRNSCGNIIDDVELIEALQKLKHMSMKVEERLVTAMETKEKIVTTRHMYNLVSQRGAIAYLCLLRLRSLDHMYQFSLEWMQSLYSKCFQCDRYSYPEALMLERVQHITSNLMKAVYRNVASALSSAHVLPFALSLCCSILIHDDKITLPEWNMFTGLHHIKNIHHLPFMKAPPLSTSPVHSARKSNGKYMRPQSNKHCLISLLDKPNFLNQQQWDACCELGRSLQVFTDFPIHVSQYSFVWKAFTDSRNPWLFNFDLWKSQTMTTVSSEAEHSTEFELKSLTQFQRLLLIQIFCPQHLASSVQSFIKIVLGEEYGMKPPLKLESIVQDTCNSTPILFVLGRGTSAINFLRKLSSNYSGLCSISLGQGQGEKAAKLVQVAAHQGEWVLLQNCHLALSWMPHLENIINGLDTSDLHSGFRLWLSSSPTTVFPSSILQHCVKIFLDIPYSLAAAMKQLISTNGTPLFTESTFEDSTMKPMWRQLMFRLCMFHSCLNGRYLYGAHGWNIPLQFTFSDLKVSLWMMRELLSLQTSTIPWNSLCYLVGDVCYGGKVTDAQDMSCLRTMMVRFCLPDATLEEGAEVNEDHLQLHHVMPTITSSTSYAECSMLIDKLPWDFPPAVLGLHTSLEVEQRSENSRALLSSITIMEYPISKQSMSRFREDKIVLEKAMDMMDRLPTLFELSGTMSSYQSKCSYLPRTELSPSRRTTNIFSSTSPLWIMLSREVRWLEDKVALVSSSLHQLRAAIRGEVAMLDEIMVIYNAFLQNEVPNIWQEQMQLIDCIIGQWFQKLLECYKFVANWAEINRESLTFKWPKNLHLSLLSRPTAQGLFLALEHEYSQATGIPLDGVYTQFTIQSQLLERHKSSMGVHLKGIYIEGVSWNSTSGRIDQCPVVDQMHPLPEIYCYPATNKEDDFDASESSLHTYWCPLYYSHSYKQLLTTIPLPSSIHPLLASMRKIAAYTSPAIHPCDITHQDHVL